MLERMQRKGNPSALLVGMQTGVATVENCMGFPQKSKNEGSVGGKMETTVLEQKLKKKEIKVIQIKKRNF